MKKRLILVIVTAGSLLLSLTGCKSAIPELSEKDMTLVTEYAAGLLLKYDANYQSMLLNDERLAVEEELKNEAAEKAERQAAIEAAKAEKKEKEQEGAAESEGSPEEAGMPETEPVESVDIAQFLELDQVSVAYNNVELKDSYPDNGGELYFSIHASEGCKLAVIHLTITNTGSADNNIDIFGKEARYKVSFNGGSYHNTMATLLENDFSMYAGMLGAGQTMDAVLLVDLKEEECGQLESINLSIKYNGETVKTPLL